MSDEAMNLDLSLLPFEHFVTFFFARRVVPDNEQFDYFLMDLSGKKYEQSAPSSPIDLVNHLTRLFSEFGHIATRYTLAQVDQGVWGIWGANLRLYEFISDRSVPLAERIACIRSMYHVYSDFVSELRTEIGPELSGLYMWWDLVLHGFWTPEKPVIPGTFRGDASKLDAESRALLDVMFETLKRILELPDKESQRAALHGLGHLHHPGVSGTVQIFIDTRDSSFPLAWLEQCRDGVVL